MLRKSLWSYGSVIFALHVLGIMGWLIPVSHNPALLGLGFLAYTFGLRHAFDADHIAAIDNTVRKLREEKKNTIGVGFFFSLGHSTVVLLMTVATAFAVEWVQNSMPTLQRIGGVAGTAVSATFLVVIGIINLMVLIQLYKAFHQARHGRFNELKLEEMLRSRGFMFRLMSPLFNVVNRSWHIYPIGFLFGLGFDTASEVALLAVSAGAEKSALPVTGILALPVLFAAGMSLMDTADGVLMTTAYDWAFSTPIRKLYYNLTMTGLSVLAAFFTGFIEAVNVVTPGLGLTKGFWGWLQHLNFGTMGMALISLFIVAWMVSFGMWKIFRIQDRWSSDY